MRAPTAAGGTAPEDAQEVMAAIRSEIKRGLDVIKDIDTAESYRDYATGITRLAEAHAWLRNSGQAH